MNDAHSGGKHLAGFNQVQEGPQGRWIHIVLLLLANLLKATTNA
jgi:hypothetical protein